MKVLRSNDTTGGSACAALLYNQSRYARNVFDLKPCWHSQNMLQIASEILIKCRNCVGDGFGLCRRGHIALCSAEPFLALLSNPLLPANM